MTLIGNSFLDEALRETRAKAGPRCGVGIYLDTLTAKVRAEVVEALDSDGLEGRRMISGTAIQRVIKNRGGNVTAQSILRHRHRKRGDGCACPE